MENYEERLKKIEAELAKFSLCLHDYQQLNQHMKNLATRLKVKSMLPVTRVAFMEGYLESSKGVTVLLGDDWFVEMSIHEACNVIERRISFVQHQLSEWESLRLKTQQRYMFLENTLKQEQSDPSYVHIREELLSSQENESQTSAGETNNFKRRQQHPSSYNSAKAFLSQQRDDSERFLEKLSVLELIEEKKPQDYYYENKDTKKKEGENQPLISSDLDDKEASTKLQILSALACSKEEPSKRRTSKFKTSRRYSSSS
jgi:prefoldin alpha subunit